MGTNSSYMCEELIPIHLTCKKIVPIIHTCEELVSNHHSCEKSQLFVSINQLWYACEELESNAKRSSFWRGWGGY